MTATSNLIHPFTPEIHTVVFYHKRCFDGLASAVAASHRLGVDGVVYFPREYEEQLPPLELFHGKQIYLLDLTLDEADLRELAAVATSVIVIDHHPRVFQQRTLGIMNAVFVTPPVANTDSGAQLAWRYFRHPKIEPNWVRWIGKGDRWIFDEPEIEPFRAGLGLMGWRLEDWFDAFADAHSDETTTQMLQKGYVILEYRGTEIDDLIENCTSRQRIAGYDVIAINAPRFLASNVAEALYNLYPPEESPFIAVYSEEQGKLRYSLRCRKGANIDVGAIARQFGGNGHPTAAGFKVTVHRAPLDPIVKSDVGLANVDNRPWWKRIFG